MIEFRISAPGKVILHGEHAVVYGKTALAASLDLRTTVAFAELPKSDSKDIIKIEFTDMDLQLDLPLQLFLDHFYGDNFHYRIGENNDSLLHEQVEQFIASLDSSCGIRIPTNQQKLSVHAFFYLLLYVGHEERIDIKPFHVNLSTRLTISAGLGSSASFAVCLAACFLHWSRLQKAAVGPFDRDDLEKISKYALNCERIIHGSPSGIDNSVCTYGSIIEFRRGEPVNVLPEMPSMKILLVNSKISRNTKDQVKRVADLRQLYPAIIDPVLDSIDVLSRTALEVIGRIRDNLDNDAALLEEYKKLLTLINMNQGLLSALDVSHLKLDVICSIARASAFAGKLTGAGGGGYAYILLLPHTPAERITNLSEQLIAEGFSVTTTSLGCNGVRIE
ncbi:mevalonate kinase [Linepithema humile]|uniref:mevalonate kinase n=1 Tax=Linepithema humile TaxID=83485 RepID=UPI00351F5D98